jgi:competence protein ComEC
VSPEISVIEVGAGNDYGHPHQKTLDRLQKVSKVYRTDLDGTITVTTDGSSYSVSAEK